MKTFKRLVKNFAFTSGLILTVALGLYYISGTEVQFIYGNF